MKSSFVVDSYSLPISQQDLIETENYLSVPAIIAAPGILTYYNQDGSETRVLVLADTLSEPSSLASLGQAAATDEHPDEPITPDNVRKYSIGNVGDVVEYDTQHGIVVRMILRDRQVIDSVKRKMKVDTSPAYFADYDNTPGVHPEFGPYDRIQTKRKNYNHVAICQEGRGDTARLLLDSADDNPLTLDSLIPSWGRLFQQDTNMTQKESTAPTALQQNLAGIKDVLNFVDELRRDAKDNPTKDEAPAIDPAALAQAKEGLGTITEMLSGLVSQRDNLNSQVEELRAELAAVLAEIQGNPAAATAEAPMDEMGEEEEMPMDEESEEVMDSRFLQYHNDREAILKVAREFSIDSVETKTNAKLRREIVEKHTAHLPEDRRLQLDSKVAVRAAFQMIESLRSKTAQPESASAGPGWSMTVDSAPKKDAQKRYEDSLRNASKNRVAK